MSDSYSNDIKLRRLEIARDLFSELLKDSHGYPADVEIDLEKNLAECMSEIKSIKSLDSNTSDPKKYAKVWTNKSGHEGKYIDQDNYDELVVQKANYDIFIIDNGEFFRKTVGKVYLNGKPKFHRPKKKSGPDETKYFTPLLYRLLVYTLKFNGSPGEVFNLIEFCWFEQSLAKSLKEKHMNSKGEIVDQDSLNESSSKVRAAASRLSTNFLNDFGVELTTSKTGNYSLNLIPNYCLIELL